MPAGHGSRRGAGGRRVAVALWVLACAALAGCGGADRVSASLESPPRPPAPEPGGGEGPSGALPDELPGLEDLELPDVLVDDEAFQRCLDLTEAYTEVVVLIYTGDPEGSSAALFDRLREQAPSDVVDDLDVLEELVRSAGDGGLLDAAGRVLNEDFDTANSAVVDWITQVCSGTGG
jgi:hypothetical protein